MNLSVAEELCIFKTGNQAQHASLFAKLQVVLKADEVVAVGPQVFLAQLHNGPGSFSGARIAQAHRLHGAKAQRVASAPGQHFDGQASLEIVQLLPLLCLGCLSGQQGIEKKVELFAIHGAVDVVGGSLVPSRSHVHAIHVDGFGFDDGRDGIVEGQLTSAGDALDFAAQRVGGERARRENVSA